MARSPPGWAAASGIRRSADRFTLILFAHPQCPCTRASIAELAIVDARTGKRIHKIVVFSKPHGTIAEAAASDLWRQASRIPDTTVLFDADGSATRAFGAAVSGHTLLYDPAGRLLFSGGITVSRGHEGDNTGLIAIERTVLGHPPTNTRTPVFGCSLHNPAPAALARDASWHR